MKPVRVIHVITRMILGGAQEDALLSLAGLRDTGDYEVGLITGGDLGPEGELMSETRRLGIPLKVVPELRREVRPHSDLLATAALRRALAELRPAIVQTHSSKAGVLGRWAARRAGVPVVLHRIHGLAFHPYETRLRNTLYIRSERLSAKWADKLIVVADAMKQQALAAGVGVESQYVRIPTGMDVTPYVRDDSDLRARVRSDLGFQDDEVVIAKIGRISDLKGHDFVVDAARGLLREVPNARFLFIGDGFQRDHIEDRCRRELPPGAVAFTGLVSPDRIPGLLQASDMLVHGSLREGLPRVLIQAFLAARPVVAFDVDGTREVVVDGETGFLVKPRDVEGLAAALADLSSNEGKRREFGRRGRANCREEFSAEALVSRTDDLYRRCLAVAGVQRRLFPRASLGS